MEGCLSSYMCVHIHFWVLWGGTMDLTYHSTVSHLMKASFDTYMVKFKGKMPPQLAQRLLNVYPGRFQT